MADFLRQMAAGSRERAALAKRPSAGELDLPLPRLTLEGFDLIAEIKNRSPAEGRLAGQGADRRSRARDYVDGGAAAISVLTEPSRFDGSLEHLAEVAEAVPERPVMRKDFLVDPVQVEEARAAGAGGVLVIVAMLDDGVMQSLLDCARELGMFVLVEAFDADDLARTATLLEHEANATEAESGRLLVGVNTRNLRTLAVDAERLASLAPALPPAARAVAESGLRDAADAARVKCLGYSLALVGTALMRSEAPSELVAAMLAAGRAA